MYACAISRPARAQGGGARVAVQLVDIASAQYYSLLGKHASEGSCEKVNGKRSSYVLQ